MKTCPHCDEAIAPGDRLATGYAFQAVHWECGLRAVIGGVNHQRGTCSCCPGGTDDPDPPDMTRREAAHAAAAEFFARQAAADQ